MSDLLVLGAFLSFAAFLVSRSRYAAIAGWVCIVFNLWTDLPAFFSENNFLYPVLAILSLPFLLITAERLLESDPAVLQLSRAAGIATVIWVPFALLPPLRDGLVALVVTLTFSLVSALGHHPLLLSWDVIAENGFSNQIIPGCTGITAMAMISGLLLSGKDLNARQTILAVLLVVPVLFLLNIARVAAVFIAVSDRWFAGFPDPTGTGDPNFFWAHNVVAEGLALLFLAWLILALFRSMPGPGLLVRSLPGVYRDRLRSFTAWFRTRI